MAKVKKEHIMPRAISDVAVEQESWVGNLHLLIVRVNIVHQGIHRLGEVIGGAHVHVGFQWRDSAAEVSSSGPGSHSQPWAS